MIEPDRALAEEARRGDRPALAALYERHKAGLLGFLIHLMRNRDAAEDVFQEVWIKVMRQVATYDPDRGPFRTWLFRIGANAAIDQLRREKRWARRTEGGEAAETRIARTPSTARAPDATCELSTEVELVRRAMAGLSVNERAAICMRHLAGLGYREIAVAIGVPEGTAKTLVHRGILALRETLPEARHE
jgi:RNA polymerase sigma-70 factor, ECF subfamily